MTISIFIEENLLLAFLISASELWSSKNVIEVSVYYISIPDLHKNCYTN
jgi:hypothetical protein